MSLCYDEMSQGVHSLLKCIYTSKCEKFTSIHTLIIKLIEKFKINSFI